MADTFRVHWAEAAIEDLEEIVFYIASDSPITAEKILGRLQSRAASLESSPRRGRIVPELAHFGMRSWRELICKPYRIVYRIEKSKVYVLAVIDGRRNIEDFLLDRLLR